MYRTTQDTQKRKDAKRQMILDTAAKVFSERGYHNATVKDIVDNAGASVGTFYFYFKSKEDIFTELYKSIVDEFNEVTMSVLDIEHFSMLKNYTRVMTATLWMYEQKREITKIILHEAATANSTFQKLEISRMHDFAQTMATWFLRFKSHDGVYIPDEQVAALIYAGSYYCLINEWLSSNMAVPLTEYGYAFCVYNLQALRIPFEENTIREYIDEVLTELNQSKQNGLFANKNTNTEVRFMNSDRRKELKSMYKSKPVIGGVCCIRCSGNQRILLQSTKNIEGLKNRYEFAISIGSCPDPSLQSEFEKYGIEAFSFDVLEEIKKGETQTDKEFSSDVDTLYEIWLEKSQNGELV